MKKNSVSSIILIITLPLPLILSLRSHSNELLRKPDETPYPFPRKQNTNVFSLFFLSPCQVNFVILRRQKAHTHTHTTPPSYFNSVYSDSRPALSFFFSSYYSSYHYDLHMNIYITTITTCTCVTTNTYNKINDLFRSTPFSFHLPYLILP